MSKQLGKLLTASAVVLLLACAATEVAPLDQVEEIPKDEARLWERSEAAADGIKQALQSGDDELQTYVDGILDRLISSGTQLSPERYPTITLLDSVEGNASAMPHGDLFISYGMLAQLDNEDQLAFILAHEVTHYLNRHSLTANRYATNQKVKSFLGDLALAAIGVPPVSGPNEAAWQLALNSRYSREQETEADLQAVVIMRYAGYSDSEAIGALEKLRVSAGEVREPLFSTHPNVGTRIAAVAELMEVEASLVEHSRVDDVYIDRIEHLLMPQAVAMINNREYRGASTILGHYLKRNPDDADAVFAHAETTRLASSSVESSTEAAKSYQKAILLGDAPPAAYRELGMHYRLVGDHAKARTFFMQYLEVAPDAIDAPIIKAYAEQE